MDRTDPVRPGPIAKAAATGLVAPGGYAPLLLYIALWVAAVWAFQSDPELDISASALFFDETARVWAGASGLPEWVHRNIGILTLTGLLAAPLAWLLGRFGRIRPIVSGRAALFVVAAFALGPGVTVNTLFKDNWGRARPVQTVLFGGDKPFTAPLMPTDHCDRNCSFVAGDPSVGFAFLAYALLLGRRRLLAVVGVVLLGSALGLMRVAQGGHFFSDAVFSGLITTGVVWALHAMMLGRGPPRPSRGEIIAFWTIVIASVPPLMIHVDLPMARWMHHLEEPVRDYGRLVTDVPKAGKYLYALGATILVLRLLALGAGGERRARLISWSFAAIYAFCAIAASGILVNILKFLFGRARPKLWFHDGIAGFNPLDFASDWHSFPSGHSADAFSIATVLTVFFPRFAPLFYLWAVLSALSRVVVGAHFPADAVMGAAIGLSVALATYHIFEHRGASPRAAVAGTARWRASPGLFTARAIR